MNTQRLSLGFAFYGLILIASAAFCFWVNSWFHATWLGIAGFRIMTWAHFFNQKHYWGFSAMLTQLFLIGGVLGWQVLSYFQSQAGFVQNKLTVSGFQFFSALFLLTVTILLISVKAAEKVRRELS